MSESSLTSAHPAAPPAPWQGGKRRLAARLIERIAAVPHSTYVEPFVGMGGVFLRRPFRARSEVINDISEDDREATLFYLDPPILGLRGRLWGWAVRPG